MLELVANDERSSGRPERNPQLHECYRGLCEVQLVQRELQVRFAKRRGMLESRTAPRFRARWHEACLGWWDGTCYVGGSSRLVDIGPGGALLHSSLSPAVGTVVHFCLDGMEDVKWICATVTSVVKSREDRHEIHLRFHCTCPHQLLVTAVRGSVAGSTMLGTC
jgi:hypothetical protein